MSLQVRRVRTLAVAHPAEGRPAHLSAGSGLVRRGEVAYVVADDELALAAFPLGIGVARPGALHPLISGTLPLGAAERKAQKPDFEALTALPGYGSAPHGALLGLGSGGRATRMRGFVWPLDEDGALLGSAEMVDLGPLYEALGRAIADLNIEGVAIRGPRLSLFQRGNASRGRNVIVDLDLAAVLDALSRGAAFGADLIGAMRDYDLGGIDGVPLGFTDGDGLPDGSLVFTAAAEATDDPYLDGTCAGSVVGVIDAAGSVVSVEPLEDPTIKIEGVDATITDDRIHLLLVADADDPAVASPLLGATLAVPGQP